jgi:hypothetical protein
MGLLDLLAGFKPHPAVPHVMFRMTPNREAFDLSFRCKQCGETLDWKCHNPDRARWRIDTWARMHAHGAR